MSIKSKLIELERSMSYERELGAAIKSLLSDIVKNGSGKVRVLDIGCGTTSMLRQAAEDPALRSRLHLVGLDVYGPTIEWNRLHGFHDDYVLSDIRSYEPDVGYDYVIATDLVEHFVKDEALSLISRMEAMVSGGVILITPNGYQENLPTDDNFYMTHKCGFSTEEFQHLGYKVYGAGGLRALRGMYAIPKWNSIFMTVFLYYMSQLMRRAPSRSFHLLARKDLSKAAKSA